MRKRRSNIRKQRGFAWERQLTKMLHELNWRALRLGGSGMPDVISTNNDYSRSLVIEAKSGYSDNLYIPAKQIQRQSRWIEESILPNMASLLAFKFASGHKPKMYYFIAPPVPKGAGLTCRNDGTVRITGTKTVVGRCVNELQTLINGSPKQNQ